MLNRCISVLHLKLPKETASINTVSYTHLDVYKRQVMSPGVPCDLPFVQKAIASGVKVISEVELAYTLTKCPVCAITGTNGKTTTTTLTGLLLQRKYKNTAVVGNIGVAYSEKVSDLTEDDYVCAEISSFQLETSRTFNPHIAAVLNITPDHLNRHKTMENYVAVKEKIFANQDVYKRQMVHRPLRKV